MSTIYWKPRLHLSSPLLPFPSFPSPSLPLFFSSLLLFPFLFSSGSFKISFLLSSLLPAHVSLGLPRSRCQDRNISFIGGNAWMRENGAGAKKKKKRKKSWKKQCKSLRTGGKVGCASLLSHLRKVHQGCQGILEPELAIKESEIAQAWVCREHIPTVLIHPLGAGPCCQLGDGFLEPGTGSLGQSCPCTWRCVRYILMTTGPCLFWHV